MCILSRKRNNKRRKDLDFYIELAQAIESRFGDVIVDKTVKDEKLAIYDYFFKSQYIEFTLYYDNHFIAGLEKYSKINHYHFYTWENGTKDIAKILDELQELLNGDILFGDICVGNKSVNAFYLNLPEMSDAISKDLDLILDAFFDEAIFRKKQYQLKLYGSRKFGELDKLYIKKK